MNDHVEVIEPREKLSKYDPPWAPSTVDRLIADLKKSLLQFPELNTAVWKVKRKNPRSPARQISINGKRIKCHTIGGTGDWWFVSVNATDAKAKLESLQEK